MHCLGVGGWPREKPSIWLKAWNWGSGYIHQRRDRLSEGTLTGPLVMPHYVSAEHGDAGELDLVATLHGYSTARQRKRERE